MANKTHRLTGTVTIESMTEFERVNTHVNLKWPEKFVAITMRSPDGMVCVTMTRRNSQFAGAVAVGQTITVSGMLKREQDYNNMGGQVVLTNCTIGVPASVGLAEKRAAKIAARKAALGF